MVEHRSVLRLVINTNYINIGPMIAWPTAQVLIRSHNLGSLGGIADGAQVLAVPQQVLLNPAAFNRALIFHRVTAMCLTTGLFNEYVDALEQAFSRLNYLLVGGDALDPFTISRALSKPAPPAHLVNVYGRQKQLPLRALS